MLIPENLLIAITVFFVPERLRYLKVLASHFPCLSKKVRVLVVTNTNSKEEQQQIRDAINLDVQITVPTYIGHPYLLTWGHLDLFRHFFRDDPSISHFMYLEDDIEIKPENMGYWVRAREDLRSVGLIPSFLRYELDSNLIRVSSDVTEQVNLLKAPVVHKSAEKYCYVNLPLPYQGMYLLDRKLAQEHFYGPSSNPDFGIWGVREKAAQGLTFARVPKGCHSRNFLGYRLDQKCIDPAALIHHLPNNYANNPNTKLGKIPLDSLFVFD